MASLSSDAGASGSAFFIDSQHLLTCNHVVEGSDSVRVWPFQGSVSAGRIVERAEEADLALIRLDSVDEARQQPAVVVSNWLTPMSDAASAGERRLFYGAGYPRDELDPGGIEVIDYGGHPRFKNDGRLTSVKLTDGNVTDGMSGGAVLDAATGAVVAVVRWSREDSDA